MVVNDEKRRISRKSIRSVLRNIDMGRFAIPKLQREFVWDGPKAAKLLDSIYRGMPIGVLLVWETPKSHRLYLRQQYNVLPPFDGHNPTVWFLIDGQQRVSVLHRVKEGGSLRNARGRSINFERVVLSLEKEKDNLQIRYRKPVPGRYLSLHRVLHPQWHQKLGHLNKHQLKKVRECRDRILDYRIHFMFVQMKINEVRECFLRINTQGMKVTTADAIFTQAEHLDLRDLVHEIRPHLDRTFEDIPEMPILWAFAVVRGAAEAGGRAVEQVVQRLNKRARDDRKVRKTLSRQWTKLGQCFGKAVDYLRQNFMVLNRGFLYSDYMVSMLALFFFWNGHGPSPRQRVEINKWFWATAVGSRYSGRNFLRCLPEDVRFIRRLTSDGNARFRFKEQVHRIDVRRSQYAGQAGISSAFYSLLLLRHPVSILDEGINQIPLDQYSTSANRKNRHHIFPRAPLRAADILPAQYNSICNICLLTADENQTIGARRPWSYLGELKKRKRLFAQKMKTHLIPVDENSGIWDHSIKRGFRRFIRSREDLICRSLEREAGIRLFRRDV